MNKDLSGEEINALLGSGTGAAQAVPAAGSLPNLDLLMDVPLELTVELGRTRRLLKEVLDLAPGVVLELNRAAGEPVDVLVNGEVIARGEVVVVDENFGIRITEIASRPGHPARED